MIYILLIIFLISQIDYYDFKIEILIQYYGIALLKFVDVFYQECKLHFFKYNIPRKTFILLLLVVMVLNACITIDQ